MKFSIWTFFSILALIASTRGHKILVLVPQSGKSQWVYMQNFVKELLHRGHEVTSITSTSIGDHKPVNYTEILIDPPFDMERYSGGGDIFKSKSTIQVLKTAMNYITDSTRHALEDKNVENFIHRTDLHFDLVIVSDLMHDAFVMFGHKFNAPMVSISPYGVPLTTDIEMGLLTPLSHVSHTALPYTDNMSFTQRWINTMLTYTNLAMQKITHDRWQTQLANKHFGHLGPLPSIDQLRRNISVTFVNAHRSITPPRPSMPGLVFIGGAHLKASKPLPTDLQTFLDESKHGAIYFSLGTVISSSKMPKEKLNAFIESFRKLKQRVIWKFDDESIPNLPKNVLIRKWLPQTDILAHPNVVLFISHGGMFSNFEAISYGIQMLMIPFVGDQHRNALRVSAAGYGKLINFDSMTSESLFDVLNEMLTDNKYSNRAKEVSAVFNDNPVHPMDEFVWWVEHVIKFRGAKQLKSHAVNMSLFTYLLLDVMLVNLLIVAIVIFIFYYAIKCCCSKKKAVDPKKQTKKTQ